MVMKVMSAFQSLPKGCRIRLLPLRNIVGTGTSFTTPLRRPQGRRDIQRKAVHKMSKSSISASQPVASTGWTGWVTFAGVILIINGVFSGLQGLVALTGPDTYYLSTPGALFLFDAKGWGWWNVALGVLLILTAVGLFSGAAWARIVTVVVAGLSAVVQLMLIPAQPWWSLIVIAIDVLIIFAVIAHGEELRTGETTSKVNS
jgi:hypothetical protein